MFSDGESLGVRPEVRLQVRMQAPEFGAQPRRDQLVG